MSKISYNKNAPSDDALEIQRWRKGKSHANEEEESQAWPSYAIPTSAYANNPDYQHGPVKTYTLEELKEYERERTESMDCDIGLDHTYDEEGGPF